ncbi:MAG: SDR family oxidoreductase, partial [Myxococcota bacterium]|nr:SDR family oxidoreductase [Myxococcota bacterium]
NIVAAAKTLEPHPKLPGTLHDTVDMVANCGKTTGARAIPVQVDVRFEERVQAMVDEALRVFGRIDYLVNNAGAIFWSPVADWPVKKFDLVMDVNVRGAFLCSRAVLPTMREQGFGHILMMSPPINPKAAPGKAPYLTSKIGMTLVAQAIDAEYSSEGIAASALWPVTGIRTAATVNLALGQDAEWRKPEILADATLEILAEDPKEARFRTWLDEEVLARAGVTDLDRYNCVPGATPRPMSIELVDPDWKRS